MNFVTALETCVYGDGLWRAFRHVSIQQRKCTELLLRVSFHGLKQTNTRTARSAVIGPSYLRAPPHRLTIRAKFTK